jgi:hypothetical protein
MSDSKEENELWKTWKQSNSHRLCLEVGMLLFDNMALYFMMRTSQKGKN